jgi:hypothetical protein
MDHFNSLVTKSWCGIISVVRELFVIIVLLTSCFATLVLLSHDSPKYDCQHLKLATLIEWPI